MLIEMERRRIEDKGRRGGVSLADDLSLTTGSTGKDLKVRSAPVGQTTIEVNRSTRDGFIVDPITGFVDFDRISVHYVSDADLNNNISNVTINT